MIGELAAVATAFVWSISSVLFTSAGNKVGSQVVNRTRLAFALIFVAVAHLALKGSPLPFEAEGYRWGFLAVSGLVGYIFGDGFLFQAFVLIGPRLSMLLMALAPVFGVGFGWAFLGESLAGQDLLGVALAIAGVALAVGAREPNAVTGREIAPRDYLIGVLCGLAAALGQAGGALLSRFGLEGGFDPLSGNAIRLLAATGGVWLMALFGGQVGSSIDALKTHRSAIGSLALAALIGPTLGVWLSLVAIQQAPLGIATTLMALVPVFLIPIGMVIYKEKVGVLAIIGTVVAIGGTALIFL